jgi:hypothetical protein
MACFCIPLRGQTNSQISRAIWPNSGLNVVCQVCEQSPTNSDHLPESELSFTDPHGKHFIAIQTADHFLSMYPIGDDDGLFVTVWVGGSAYHINVFVWEDNKPVCVLESGSKSYPEIIFDVTKSHDIFFLLNDAPGGPDDPENWVTRRYRWDGEKMLNLKKVPAIKRFQSFR